MFNRSQLLFTSLKIVVLRHSGMEDPAKGRYAFVM
jgi:hypothetical protein